MGPIVYSLWYGLFWALLPHNTKEKTLMSLLWLGWMSLQAVQKQNFTVFLFVFLALIVIRVYPSWKEQYNN